MTEPISAYTIFIDSRQRVSGTSDNFLINQNPPLQLKKSTNYFRASIQYATIPFSFKQVNNSNNTFYIQFNSTVYPVQIPNGNYNILQLATAVSQAIVSALSAVRTITLSITYDRATGLITVAYLTCSAPTVGTLRIFSGTTVATMIGLSSDLVINLGSTATGGQSVDVNPIRRILIRSDTLKQIAGNTEHILAESEYSDILGQIPVLVNAPQYVQGSSVSPPVRITTPLISQINLYLSSDQNYELSLNGLDWSCVLLLEEFPTQTIETDTTVAQLAENQRRISVSDLEKQKERVMEALRAERERLRKSLAEN